VLYFTLLVILLLIVSDISQTQQNVSKGLIFLAYPFLNAFQRVKVNQTLNYLWLFPTLLYSKIKWCCKRNELCHSCNLKKKIKNLIRSSQGCPLVAALTCLRLRERGKAGIFWCASAQRKLTIFAMLALGAIVSWFALRAALGARTQQIICGHHPSAWLNT